MPRARNGKQNREKLRAARRLADVLPITASFRLGERWQYGIGMDWVGKLVEAVTDQSLEVYFREHIFTPLGMGNSGFLISSAQKQRVATMHNRQPDGSHSKRHLKAVSTSTLRVSKVMPITSSSGDHFDDRVRLCREPHGAAELHA